MRILKKELTTILQIITLSFRDRSDVTFSPVRIEPSVLAVRRIKSWIGSAALFYSGASHCSFLCERPGPCYGRAVFVRDDLAH
jgi:hypothetical protein